MMNHLASIVLCTVLAHIYGRPHKSHYLRCTPHAERETCTYVKIILWEQQSLGGFIVLMYSIKNSRQYSKRCFFKFYQSIAMQIIISSDIGTLASKSHGFQNLVAIMINCHFITSYAPCVKHFPSLRSCYYCHYSCIIVVTIIYAIAECGQVVIIHVVAFTTTFRMVTHHGEYNCDCHHNHVRVSL